MKIMKLTLVLLIIIIKVFNGISQDCSHGVYEMKRFSVVGDDRLAYKELGFDYQNTSMAYLGELNEEGCAKAVDLHNLMWSKSNKKKMKKFLKQNYENLGERTKSLREKKGRYLVNVEAKDSIGVLMKNGDFVYGDIIDPYSCEYLKRTDFKSGNLMQVPTLKFKRDDDSLVEINYDDIEKIRRVVMITVALDSVKLSIDEYSRMVVNGESILVCEVDKGDDVRIYKSLNYVCLWMTFSKEYGEFRYADPMLLVTKNGNLIHKYGLSYPSLNHNGNIRKELNQDDFDELRRDVGEDNELVKAIQFLVCQGEMRNKKSKFSDRYFQLGIVSFIYRDIQMNKVVIAEKI